jgi:CelD/BcsL family acetyltransferase involved in cellulose biosynthesis
MAAEPAAVEIQPVRDFASLGTTWRALELRSQASFFQSWAWTGCLAEERFGDPWLLTARRGDRVVALGLFNRASAGRLGAQALFLGESGDAGRDTIFIEHNGLLADHAEEPALHHACWQALADHPALGKHRWRVSGVAQSVVGMIADVRPVRILAQRPTFHRDLTRMGGSALGSLSANTRQQLRRSLRGWEAFGALTLTVAAREEAGSFLDGLKALHQAYWIGRDKPGAFAEPFFERFHRALIDRVGAGQSVELIRIQAGDRVVGYLYNLIQDGWVAAYQSGFDYGADADRLRPGLICHLMAMDHYAKAGMRLYDFLGGEARYKRSLADSESELSWLEAGSPSPLGAAFNRLTGRQKTR